MKILTCRCGISFETTHGNKKYCSSKCQIFYNSRNVWAASKSNFGFRATYLLSAAKNRAKTKNIPFDLDREFLLHLWEEQEGLCCISGYPLNLETPINVGQPRFDAPSLDRIVPALGYVKGNVRLVCYQINCAIHDYGAEHFLKLCRAVITHSDVGIF
jgi:hypothetical protein